MTIIGVSGSIASGKSEVSKFFRDLGAHLIDLDKVGHDVIRPRLKAWKEIVKHFGRGVLNEDQSINRQTLGQLVFEDPEKLDKLNEIVHPEIFKEFFRLVEERKSQNPHFIIVAEIPLLNEINRKLFDTVVLVYVSEKTQIKRLSARGFTEEEAKKRIKAQLSNDEKRELADFVIYNEGPLEETRRQVEKIYSQIVPKESHI